MSSDNELANKKVIDHELNVDTILRFNQPLEIYLKISVGNDVCIFTDYGKI